MSEIAGLYFGPPTADKCCGHPYRQPGRRCPNHIDFLIKPGGGSIAERSPGTYACGEHLASLLWGMDIGTVAGYYTVITAGSDYRDVPQ